MQKTCPVCLRALQTDSDSAAADLRTPRTLRELYVPVDKTCVRDLDAKLEAEYQDAMLNLRPMVSHFKHQVCGRVYGRGLHRTGSGGCLHAPMSADALWRSHDGGNLMVPALDLCGSALLCLTSSPPPGGCFRPWPPISLALRCTQRSTCRPPHALCGSVPPAQRERHVHMPPSPVRLSVTNEAPPEI